jgi:hypothetical protein
MARNMKMGCYAFAYIRRQRTCICTFHRRMGHEFRFLLPLFSTTPLLFSKFSYKSFLFPNFHNHSFFLHFLFDAFILADTDYYSNIRDIFHILLTMPIRSVPCERSFYDMRRLKQRSRTTMVEDRLSGLAL